MSASRLRVLLPILLLVSWIGVSGADLNKLDPRVRIALSRLRTGTTVEQMRRDRAAVTSQGDLDVFIRGPVTRAELEALGVRVRTALPGIYTANLPVRSIEAVAALPGVLAIRGSAPCEPELDLSVPASMAPGLRGPGPAFTGLNGAGVLIGDVDSGIDWTHGDFDDQAGNTRLIKIWDQSDLGGPTPASYSYGTEWTPADINANLPREFDGGNGHGTHVMGIAGGDGSQTGGAVPAFTYIGMAPKADLVMVKTDFQTGSIVDGVAYCDSLATARGQSVVVNLSLGSQFGPHDGTSDFETALGLLTGAGKLIVKSAGNDRGLARHADIPTAARDSATMNVAGSATSRLIAIDGYYSNAMNLSVIVRTPNGTTIGPIAKGGVNASYPGTATANGVVYVENGFTPTLSGDPEVYVEINVNAGQSMNGVWTYTIVPVSGGGAGDVDLWRYFSSGGVQANFVRNNAPNQELITEPGNAPNLITVGAYVTRDVWTGCNALAATYGEVLGNLGTFSSPGPTRDGRIKPDLVAPGSSIASTTADVGSQICPGAPSVSNLLPDGMNHIVMEGTSMAAPHVTGALALLMQNFGPLTVAQAKAMLAAHATVDASTGAVPNNNWGNGKLHLDAWTATVLAMFVATPRTDGIELRWQLERGAFASVTPERSEHATGPWVALDAAAQYVDGATVVLDRTAERGHTYWYRLRATAENGATTIFGPLSGTAGQAIAGFELDRVAPNPSPGETRIGFTLPRSAPVWVGVVDVQGREVAVLVDGVKPAGRYEAVWNGAAIPAGLYFVRYRTPAGEHDRRVAIVH